MSIDSLIPPPPKPKVNDNGVPLFKQKVTKRDIQVDNEVKYEFGGPVGVCAMMIGFPCLMYYFWICLEYHQGKLIYLPLSQIEQWKPWFINEVWNKIKQDAYPSWWAIQVYMGYVLFSFVLAHVMPGPVVEGLPVPSLNGKKVQYLCNGLSSWYLTLALSLVFHVTRVFRITLIIDHFGELMTVAIIWGFVMSTVVYIAGIAMGKAHRMSGNIFYDYFMGSFLNPRIGNVDLKMWAEIRVPWPVLFYLSLSCLLKQYETYGYITTPTIFMVLAHFLYVNACQKGEECIPTSWDIIYEKNGFMLIFWNMAGVPFTYCYSSIYLMKYQLTTGHAITHNWPCTVALFTLLLIGYYIFDTGNSQKNRFRMEQNGSFITRNAFPQLPWGRIHNPTYISTKHGNLLLTSGWWGIARKPHYTADLMMAISWGLVTGFSSLLPYFYFCFFLCVLTHRVSRDMDRCAKKYGQDWDEYCRQVPYIFIPYVF